ncbi:MAG: hypothetical protein FWD76_01475 [Firmicutes bacterium]|nr:hypothetical protein [Bacillota bacterium]
MKITKIIEKILEPKYKKAIKDYFGDRVDEFWEELDNMDRSILFDDGTEEFDGHNPDHIERVVVLGLLLCVSAKAPLELWRLLLVALKYHDCGRVDNQEDPAHSGRSADIVQKMYESKNAALASVHAKEELEMIKIAIQHHSLDSKLLTAFAKDSTQYQLCAYLKDADCLDRVRFVGLDPAYLLTPHAKKMEKFADWFHSEYVWSAE